MGQAKARGTYEQRVASATPQQRPFTKRQLRAIAMQEVQQRLHKVFDREYLKPVEDDKLVHLFLDDCNDATIKNPLVFQ